MKKRPECGTWTSWSSDSVLAFDRFRRKVPFGHAVVMATYIAAQLMIVLGLMAA